MRRRYRRRYLGAAAALAVLMTWPAARAGSVQPCPGAETWTKVGQNSFRAEGLPRSQGVAPDGNGWVFSWQGGLQRTDRRYRPLAVATWPPGIAVQPTFHLDGTNHIGGNHIGDVDVYGGLVYAPIEDGGQDFGPIKVNNPEYQHPYIALYDAKTLLYTGKHYALPLELHEAGVPWVAVNAGSREVYTAEWDMPHDRINAFDLTMHFQRFIDLQYPASFGTGFHLSRIQGAKVFGDSLYATRDDAGKSVFKIDLATGAVTKVFSLNPGAPAELEGMAIRPTADGALLHLLIVIHDPTDRTDFIKDVVEFQHFALQCS